MGFGYIFRRFSLYSTIGILILNLIYFIRTGLPFDLDFYLVIVATLIVNLVVSLLGSWILLLIMKYRPVLFTYFLFNILLIFLTFFSLVFLFQEKCDGGLGCLARAPFLLLAYLEVSIVSGNIPILLKALH